jgi:hypothetical protein
MTPRAGSAREEGIVVLVPVGQHERNCAAYVACSVVHQLA